MRPRRAGNGTPGDQGPGASRRMRRRGQMIGTGVALAVLWLAGGCGREAMEEGGRVPEPHVVLVGASVGKEWNLGGLAARGGTSDATYESLTVYQFDKSEALGELLIRPRRRFRLTRTYLRGLFHPPPKVADVVILKECAAYFPGDLPAYEALVQGWVAQLRRANKRVILATVVPVTRAHDATKPGRMEAIRRFNDWLRSYAVQEALDVLDLEEALREDARERFLAERFTSGDGLHLNRGAYEVLDAQLLAVVAGS